MNIKDYLHFYIGCECQVMVLGQDGYDWHGPYNQKIEGLTLSELNRGVFKDVKFKKFRK